MILTLHRQRLLTILAEDPERWWHRDEIIPRLWPTSPPERRRPFFREAVHKGIIDEKLVAAARDGNVTIKGHYVYRISKAGLAAVK